VVLHSIPYGRFTSPFNQQLADDMALSQCFKEAQQRKLCFGFPMDPACVDEPYEHIFTVTGGTMPYNIQISAASLPVGFTLNNATGYFSGTGASPGVHTLVMSVTDSSTPPIIVHKNFTFYVVEITNASLSDGFIGTAYSDLLVASVALPGASWNITGGSLPPGLTLNPATGEISGTPTASGTYSFTVELSTP
jgi:large repetitive protein